MKIKLKRLYIKAAAGCISRPENRYETDGLNIENVQCRPKSVKPACQSDIRGYRFWERAEQEKQCAQEFRQWSGHRSG